MITSMVDCMVKHSPWFLYSLLSLELDMRWKVPDCNIVGFSGITTLKFPWGSPTVGLERFISEQ